MKKLLVVLFVLLAGLLLFSCKKSTSLDEDFDLSNAFDKDVVVFFSNYNYDDETFAAVYVSRRLVDNIQTDVTLKVNGIQSELWDIDYDTGRIEYYFDVPYVFFGSSFNYDVKVGSKHYTGSIKHPDKYYADFPYFNENRNYTFTWSLASNAEYQFVDYEVYGEFDDDWDYIYESVKIKPADRTYSINKTKWRSFDEAYDLWAGLIAMNVKKHGSTCSVYAYSETDNDEDDDWKGNRDKLHKRHEQIMNMLANQ